MSPEAAIATLTVVRIGAIYTPCFSGFGAGAVVSRLSDCEATLLITADGFYRRGQVVKMKETADEAVAQCPSVQTVLVYRRLGGEIPWTTGRDRWWHDAVTGQSDRAPALPVEADRPCLIIHTSGTTGRPKGAVLTHGGFLIKTPHDFGYCMDVGEHDRLFWLTDLGWLMGPMAFTAALFHGATVVVFEGVQDYPKPNRLWSVVERHRITVMGISPTAVRALMPHGPEHVHAHDLSSLRIIGSTGEPWNPEPYRWLNENAGKARLPIINYIGIRYESGRSDFRGYQILPRGRDAILGQMRDASSRADACAMVREPGQGRWEHAGWAGRSRTMSREVALVSGRPCDLPGCAASADP
jgi:acetyl-CoA synthetase